jgi:hypothetical protein
VATILRCVCLALVSHIFCLVFRKQKEACNAGYLQLVKVAAFRRGSSRLLAEMRTGIVCLHFSYPDSICTRARRFLRCIPSQVCFKPQTNGTVVAVERVFGAEKHWQNIEELKGKIGTEGVHFCGLGGIKRKASVVRITMMLLHVVALWVRYFSPTRRKRCRITGRSVTRHSDTCSDVLCLQ